MSFLALKMRNFIGLFQKKNIGYFENKYEISIKNY